MPPCLLGHLVVLGRVARLAPGGVDAAARDPLLHLPGVLLHHAVERELGALDDGAEALLLDLALQLRVRPARVVVGDVYLRVVLVPGREALVNVGPDGPERAVDEIDDARYFGLAV